ncbi:hypothetical protein GTP58_17000 [Duganella sp. CY15W]|uniref:hypothetical protein n=1 Tax=Duganella sp. CY15W TaxID=2692172 RepID=UPI00136FBF6E|nr:hypothetical protein [Duganella sp. CY15W]MYM30031.1 hypothetical protein [Duganella sp. CY15W]
MLSISTKVERIVLESAFLTEGLRRGLINLSELARQLQPQLESDLWKPVGQAAVVMALRRVAERLPQEPQHRTRPLRQGGELTTRTELTEYTYRYSDSIQECHRQLLVEAEPMRGAFVTVTRGVNEVMVICSGALTGVVESVFARERLLARQNNLSAVTLHLNPDTRRTPGIYHAILKQLAWDKVSLINMICTYTELTILLEQSQTGAAFSVLSRLALH